MARQVSRRQVLGSLLALGFSRSSLVAEAQSKRQNSLLPVRVSTINHVSFGCADVRASVRWYGRVFGMAVHAFQDYRGGQTVLRVGDGPSYMALSQLDPKNAGKPPSRLPHFCWGTPDFNIDRIIRALAEMQAPAQAVLREGKTINGINFDDPDGFPLQFNPVTACGGGGFLGDVCDASAKPDRSPNDPPPIPVRTLNHVKLIVPNLQRTLDWYLKLTDMKLKGAEPGDNGSEIRILRVGPGPQFVALSEGSGPAAFRPHVGFGVQGFDPNQIIKRLGDHGITPRTRLRDGVAAEVLVDSPDGVEIHLQDVSGSGEQSGKIRAN